MTNPTPADIAAIRERRSKITPPPWYADNPDDDHAMNVLLVTTNRHGVGDLRTPFDEYGEVVAITMLQTPRFAGVADSRWDENTEFIAHSPTDIDTLLAAIAERDDTIERLTREAAMWDVQASARHADVTALQAEVARLTAERDEANGRAERLAVNLVEANKRADEAAAKIQSEIVEWLRTESRHHAWGETTKRALWAAADALEFSPWQRWMEFIARGEPQGENDA